MRVAEVGRGEGGGRFGDGMELLRRRNICHYTSTAVDADVAMMTSSCGPP